MRVAVTGASGFVGGAIATHLAAAGHEVTGFGRTPGVTGLGSYRMWHLTSGPLANPPTVDAVVHAAALVDDWVSLDEARSVNVDGTRAVLDTFPAARFVHLSTASVYRADKATVNAVESAGPARRFLSVYAQTKAESEALFVGHNAAILRPHAVYGPDDTTLLPRLVELVRDGEIALPAGGNVLHSLTSLDNLAQAVELAIAPKAARGVFNIADAEPVILGSVVRELLTRAVGSDVTIRTLGYRTAYTAAAFAELGARLRRGRPRITRFAVTELGRERTLDITAARERLGFIPRSTSTDFG